VSRYGVFPLAESLDHVGPMTRRVTDAALMLAAIAGYDPKDETSLSAPVEDYAAAVEQGVGGLRIGMDEAFITKGTSTEVSSAVLEAVSVLERLGARIVKVSFPSLGPALAAAMTVMTAEAAAAHESTYPSRASEYGAGFRSFLEMGSQVRGQDYAKDRSCARVSRIRFRSCSSKLTSSLVPQCRTRQCPPPQSRLTLAPSISRMKKESTASLSPSI
jgi:amidase